MPKEPKDPLFDSEDLYAFNVKDDIEELMESISIGGFDRFADSSYDSYDSDNYGFDDRAHRGRVAGYGLGLLERWLP